MGDTNTADEAFPTTSQNDSPRRAAWEQGNTSSSEKGYPPNQQGFPASQQGYPANQQGHPASQQGYPANQQGYPASQQHYPAGQQGNPTQPPPPPPSYQDVAGVQYNPNQAPPAQVVVVRSGQGQPPDHMVFAVIVAFCCCLPFGAVAIIKSAEVRSRYSVGDIAGAQEASQSAKKWAVWGLIAGVTWNSMCAIAAVVYNILSYTYFYEEY